MTDIPILFSGPMVRALLLAARGQPDGKTQTRQLAWKKNNAPSPWQHVNKGDRLWVREVHWRLGRWLGSKTAGKVTNQFRPNESAAPTFEGEVAGAECPFPPGKFGSSDPGWHKRPGIFLPRELSRLTLTIIDKRIEPLQNISAGDAMAEGIMSTRPVVFGESAFPAWCGFDGAPARTSPCGAFFDLWDHVNGNGAASMNPTIVALTFNVHECNVDQLRVAA